MIASNALEPIRDLFDRHSTESIQQRFRTIYSRAQESATNQHHNIITPESTSLDLSTIDDILNLSLHETIEERSETPPPPYEKASCLPSYTEACKLIPSNESETHEAHIHPNPVSEIENSHSLYVNIPNLTTHEPSSSDVVVPLINHSSDTSTLPNSRLDGNNLTQQISNSVFGAYAGILHLLPTNSVTNETLENSNQDINSSSESNDENNPSSSHGLNHGHGETTTEGPRSIIELLSDSYTTASNTANQIVQSFQAQSQNSNNQDITERNVVDTSSTVEDGSRDRIFKASDDDDRFGFHGGWCTFFRKQCELIFRCFAFIWILFMVLFVLWRLFIF